MNKNEDAKIDVARHVIVSFRLTQIEASRIDTASSLLKRPRTRADYCRATALYSSRQAVPAPALPVRHPPKRTPALDTRLLSSILADIGKVGSNVNQMAHVANTTRRLPAEQALIAIAKDITIIRSAISSALKGEEVGET